MRRNTRQEILLTAKRLFNQYGFHGVTMNEIAEGAGITKTNLNYYFTQKEQVMECLYEEEIGSLVIDTPTTIRELDEMILTIQDLMVTHRYLFLNHAELGQISDKIYKFQLGFYKMFKKNIHAAFEKLHADGIFRDELIPGELDCMADSVYMATIYWSSYSSLQRSAQDGVQYHSHVWGVMYNVLTEKGREDFEEYVQI